ncbi:hypothetical protein PSYMO_33767 [Pseudomonas amygdali pv. mori str. 301020]|uniref:Uncharacterized protein n=1 Tax=Pseudomonas amygdali pv. mori str. 301020 TaxID=629261 RepID=A0A656GKU9_PSEA0|nr:hypothetical protein PSYMO_33767 [Pseudomonas amygdali pv. mori str. 301020]
MKYAFIKQRAGDYPQREYGVAIFLAPSESDVASEAADKPSDPAS